VSILMITHAGEVMVWALAYWLVDATPPEANRVYFVLAGTRSDSSCLLRSRV
jgi:hypothetical protein